MFKVFENFRVFDEKDSFKTDQLCRMCGKQYEQYVIMLDYMICKSCLTRAIEMLDKNFMNHCDNDWKKRKENENV